MPEESVAQAEITPEATAQGNQGYAEALKVEGSPTQEAPVVKTEVTEDPNAQKANALPDPEFDLGDGTKLKLSEIKELQAGNLRQQDYTKKTQELAPLKKSIVGVYGDKLPDLQTFQAEMANFASLRKAYLEKPQVKQVVDAIISGQDFSKMLNGQPEGQLNQTNLSPETQALKQELEALKQQLSGFTETQTRQAEARIRQEVDGIWNGWVDKMAKSGVQITQEINTSMAPFIDALTQAHPDWDDSKVLDMAHRHATIGDVTKQVTSQVLQQADKAKNQTPAKINPKVGTKPDKDKSYSEIMREAL